MFSWSNEFDAWIVTVDKDARLTIEEIREIVGKDHFIVRVSEDSVN